MTVRAEVPAPPLRGPFVGVSAIVVRDGAVLLGLRRGAHGAGTWSFPGGKVDTGEDPAVTAARELREETGLAAVRVTPVGWTSDLFPEAGLHYVTLHFLVEAVGEPVVREPEKAREWSWHGFDALPAPLFTPVAALLDSGWRPDGVPREPLPG
ncbi:NUDIX domain-containing protein [Micromonospora sp. NPDC049559]|uniref:nucleotide triphosphate diphosphatase NUDT15 n=1 Tax=Micromonospora sp. NPDC049559 TaxID=3155923 RepID=UPI00341CCCAB